MANPILASDLYQDDGAITAAIKQLEELAKQHAAALEKVKKEAISVEVQVKKLNTTTAEGRQQIKETAQSTDELEKRFEKYAESLDETAVKIAALKEAQREINNVNKLQAKLAAALEGSYNQLSAQYSLNKIRLNQMSAEQRKATAEGQKLEKQTKEIYEEMKRLQEATGKHVLSVGDYGKALRDIPGPLGRVINDLAGFRDGLSKGIKGLQSMVGGLGGANKALTLFKIALASTGLGLVIIALGALYAAFTRTQEGIDAVNRVLSALKAGFDVIIDRASLLGNAIIKLFQRDFRGAAADFRASIAGIGREMGEETKQAAKLTGALQKIRDESRALGVTTEETRAKIKELNLIAEDTSRGTKERAKAARDAFNIEKGLLAQREDLAQRELDAVRKQKALGNSLAGDLDEIAEKEKALAQVRQNSLELQTTLNNKLNTINQEGANRAKAQAQEAEQTRKAVAALADEIAESAAILGGPAAVARLEYDRAITKINQLKAEARSLGADLDFSTAEILAQAKYTRAIDAIRISVVEKLPAAIKEALDPTKEAFTGLISEGAKAAKEAVTKEVRGIAEKVAAESRKGGITSGLFDFLDDDQKQGITSAFDFAKQQLFSYLAVRTEVANRLVEQSDREVDAARQALQNEIDNRNAGYANQVETAARSLDLAKKNQDKALREQEKARRAQERAQTVEQTVNLITATSKIWAQLGFPFALPAIGVMWGSFIAAKIRAAQLSKKQFREGGYELLQGGSHGTGNDIPLGVGPDGRERRAEGGEAMAIFNRRNTRKYKSLLPEVVQAINRGTFEAKFQAIGSAGAGLPIVINAGGLSTRRMEDELSAIRRQGETRYYNEAGRLIEVRGNVKRIYV